MLPERFWKREGGTLEASVEADLAWGSDVCNSKGSACLACGMCGATTA